MAPVLLLAVLRPVSCSGQAGLFGAMHVLAPPSAAVALIARPRMRLVSLPRLHVLTLAGALVHVPHEHLFGAGGEMPLTVLYFLEKLHELLVSGPLRILEILHTGLTTL
jgi:hypothetical protein